jgi:prevent-host-death family protein
MRKIGAFEAKTRLGRLLRDVETHQEDIVITRHNRSVACLVPADRVDRKRLKAAGVLAAFKDIRSRQSSGGVSLTSLIEDGRKR